MNIQLTLIASILAVLAAVVLGYAGLLARPIEADLGQNLQDLTTILDETFSRTPLFLNTLRSMLGKTVGSSAAWSDEALSQAVLALQNVAGVYENEVKRIAEYKVRDFSQSELAALSARA